MARPEQRTDRHPELVERHGQVASLDVGLLVLSARQVQYLTVSYLSLEEPRDPGDRTERDVAVG
jgi:hypothetical protein